MISNRYGILEPRVSPTASIDLADCAVIFIPLLGFNPQGYRLGMGEGYYDRTLAPFAPLSLPKRIGLAWSCQACDFEPQPWDIQCHVVVTENQSCPLEFHF